jgi:hypothetical protein
VDPSPSILRVAVGPSVPVHPVVTLYFWRSTYFFRPAAESDECPLHVLIHVSKRSLLTCIAANVLYNSTHLNDRDLTSTSDVSVCFECPLHGLMLYVNERPLLQRFYNSFLIASVEWAFSTLKKESGRPANTALSHLFIFFSHR